MEWQYGSDYSQEFERNSQEGEAKQSVIRAGAERSAGTLWSGEMRSIASAADINAVGHRVVHGGPHFHHPVRIS